LVGKLGPVASALLACLVLATATESASARSTFRPRIGGAMGIVPPAGRQEIALGSNIPNVYHGGQVMRDVTVHTLFWAPSGFRFGGPPALLRLGYEQLIQQFFTDVATDSGSSGNVFSVLGEYNDATGSAGYSIRYNATTNSIRAIDPFPASGHQCASPAGVATCVTDLQIQQELDRVIQAHDPGARGLGHVWFVFLPPNVDTCISAGSCGTNAFGGYHSLSNLGHGVTIYANVPDPLIEMAIPHGSDPQGNPDAEAAIDVAAHEAVEAITDPTGTGWMDPNGLEVGDKCQSGPQHGTPLGYALLNGAPYNQVINGHQYLIQGMWSNAVTGCVQRSTLTTSPLPLAQVRLTQFSPLVSGNIGSARRGIRVVVALRRAGKVVARAVTRTAPSGSWGPVALRSVSGRGRHAVGDDRDEIDVTYGPGGPAPDTIQTGNGGNPFTQSGFTGWFDLDHGFAVVTGQRRGVIAVGPCSQTGVLGLTIDRRSTVPPADLCETEADVSLVRTNALSPGATLRLESNDNRASSPGNPNGALVSLGIQLGEPNSVAALGNDQVPFDLTGFPSCTAHLRLQTVGCSGLVPGVGYTVTRGRGHVTRRARANDNGSITVGGYPGAPGVAGGDVFSLAGAAHRRLTALHVAHLRVNITGKQSVIAGGTCEPGAYYGPPLAVPPVSRAVGEQGVTGKGTICPANGDARGLSTPEIRQTDEFSGGQTDVQVPDIVDTSPSQGATVYGPFIALADAGLVGPHNSLTKSRAAVSLTISSRSGGPPVFFADNVNTPSGVTVGALPAGIYAAKWVLVDANGDTRTVRTRFVAEPARLSRDRSTPVF
jgi:hypothetical protein